MVHWPEGNDSQGQARNYEAKSLDSVTRVTLSLKCFNPLLIKDIGRKLVSLSLSLPVTRPQVTTVTRVTEVTEVIEVTCVTYIPNDFSIRKG